MKSSVAQFIVSASILSAISGCGGSDDSDTPAPTELVESLAFSGEFYEQETVTAIVTLNESVADNEEYTLSYEWRDLSGVLATGASIAFEPSHIGKEVFVRVTYVDDLGNEYSKDSRTYVIENRPELKVIYESSALYEATFVSSNDNGETWSSASTIYSDLTDDDDAAYQPRSATDNKGNIVVVWTTEYVDAFGGEYDIAYSYSHDNGATFSTTGLINPSDTHDSQGDEDATIATDEQGNWVVVWSSSEQLDGSGTDSDIFFVHSTDNGVSWSSPKLVNNFGVNDNAQDWGSQIRIHGDTWIVVWMTSHNIDGEIGTDRDIVVSYSEDQGATWSEPEAINPWASEDSDSDYLPHFDVNESGVAVTVWAGHNGDADLDVYAAISSDFGKTWSNAKLINTYGDSDSDSDHDYPKNAYVSADNTVVVTWEGKGTYDGDDEEIYLSYSYDLGNTWSDEVILNNASDSTNDQYGEVIQSPDGKWVACWVDGSDQLHTKTSDDLINWSPSQVLGSSYYSCNLLYH